MHFSVALPRISIDDLPAHSRLAIYRSVVEKQEAVALSSCFTLVRPESGQNRGGFWTAATGKPFITINFNECVTITVKCLVIKKPEL